MPTKLTLIRLLGALAPKTEDGTMVGAKHAAPKRVEPALRKSRLDCKGLRFIKNRLPII
jgi:hypothetical protein